MANFKPQTEERGAIIIFAVIILYLLICGFIFYFYYMKKLSLLFFILLTIIFTVFYIPRFFIIYRLLTKDVIKIDEETMSINGQSIEFSRIKHFRIEKKKPVIVFFINNSIVLFNEGTVTLDITNGKTITFRVYGKEKIELIEEFLTGITESYR